MYKEIIEYRNVMFSRALLAAIWILSFTLLPAQHYHIDDMVSNFTLPICINGEGNFSLDQYNGDLNGGDHSVLLFMFFTST